MQTGMGECASVCVCEYVLDDGHGSRPIEQTTNYILCVAESDVSFRMCGQRAFHQSPHKYVCPTCGECLSRET